MFLDFIIRRQLFGQVAKRIANERRAMCRGAFSRHGHIAIISNCYFSLCLKISFELTQYTSPFVTPFHPLFGGGVYLFEKKKYLLSGDI